MLQTREVPFAKHDFSRLRNSFYPHRKICETSASVVNGGVFHQPQQLHRFLLQNLWQRKYHDFWSTLPDDGPVLRDFAANTSAQELAKHLYVGGSLADIVDALLDIVQPGVVSGGPFLVRGGVRHAMD